jgi:hypothetical protein
MMHTDGTLRRPKEDRMDEREKTDLRKQIIEGCNDMSDIYLDMERDFHPLEEEALRIETELPSL